MKPRYYAAITLALAALSPAFGGEVAVATALSAPPTHEDLAKRKAQGKKTMQGVTNFAPAEPRAVKRKEKEAAGLISRSTILSFGGFWTIVPKHAVLHVPANYQSRISERPSGRLLSWHDFYRRNRGWIYTQNVKISDARGDTTLPPKTLEAYERTGRLVVAVCHQGPISVKRRKADPEAPSASNS